MKPSSLLPAHRVRLCWRYDRSGAVLACCTRPVGKAFDDVWTVYEGRGEDAIVARRAQSRSRRERNSRSHPRRAGSISPRLKTKKTKNWSPPNVAALITMKEAGIDSLYSQ